MSSLYSVTGATHAYGAAPVLDSVDLALRGGSIHALLGANGSGKSTLIKVLTGAIRPDAGTLAIDDAVVDLSSPRDAHRSGVAFVHQDNQLYPDLTVAQNIWAASDDLPRRRHLPVTDRREVRARVRALLDDLELDVAPDAEARKLDAASRKLVEIARAMLGKPRFLFLDEPTASLEPHAAGVVLDVMRRLSARGVGVCFVSHRLDEVEEVADEGTVLRDGRVVARLPARDLRREIIVRHMVGHQAPVERRVDPPRATGRAQSGSPRSPDAPLLELRELCVSPSAEPLSLSLRPGEIVGLTGLVGSGAHAVLRSVAGVSPLPGTLLLDGRAVRSTTPAHARRLGIGYLPEDRKGVGVLLERDVVFNVNMASFGDAARYGVLRTAELVRRAATYVDELDIKTPSLRAPLRALSGGNQQKVMIAKWLGAGAHVLAIEEPTQGVDIRGRDQIHELLRAFAADGHGVLISTTDVHELLDVCDRVGVMRHGSLAAMIDVSRLAGDGEPGAATDAVDLLERIAGGEVAAP